MYLILPLLISHNQSAFVKGRSIGENILLAHELVRHIHLLGGSNRLFIKVDLRKAFDRLR